MKKLIFFLAILLCGIISYKSSAQATVLGNTVSAADFLGTANAFPVRIGADGHKAGWVDYTSPYNTTLGFEALNSINGATLNIAIGFDALFSNTTLNENIAVGDSALYMQSYTATSNTGNIAIGNSALYNNQPTSISTGYENVAVGQWAMKYNTTGSFNTASGNIALYSNTTGGANTAIGAQSLAGNVTGSSNTAVGSSTLANSGSGSYNTAIGGSALGNNNTGSENTATGIGALFNNSSGTYNTATGINALLENTVGSSNAAIGSTAGVHNTASFNTFLGDSSGVYNTTGTYNTYVGYFSGGATGFNTITNTTCLGYASGVGAATMASNSVYIGNGSITNIYAVPLGFSTYSDRRIKDNIQENVPGLAFISKLHAVTYHLNLHKENNFLGVKDDKDWKGKYDIENINQSGFIAQQVDSAAQACGYNFNGVSKPQNQGGLYTLNYTAFVVPLVKAVQELSAKNDSLTTVLQNIQTCLNQICSGTGSNFSATTDGNSSLASEQNITLSSADAPLLYQNSPNPFSTGTKINYYLPEGTMGAVIVFYDSYGNQIRTVQLSQTGNGTLSITPDNLTNGIYSYSLIVNSRVVDTKRMVLQK